MLFKEEDKTRKDKRGMDLSLKKVTTLPDISLSVLQAHFTKPCCVTAQNTSPTPIY